jgi:magnesium chelatase subunit I
MRDENCDVPLVLPYTRIVGQEDLKLALELNYINPRIGGVLIEGERGTAKSTTVRAFSLMMTGKLPVTLPINATEDRVIGSYKIDSLLRAEPNPEWQKGLLEQADGGILYVDEVNLLDDHIVNLILDASSTGILVIQRENKDETIPVSFGLIGTMNPEEGDLRPQLLDRFGLCVAVKAEETVERRRDILKAVLDFDRLGVRLIKDEEKNLEMVKARLEKAKEKILKGEVEISEKHAHICARIAESYMAEGHRGDYVIALAAQAFAALEGKPVIHTQHIGRVAPMALRHRLIDMETRERRPWEEKMLEKILKKDNDPL